MVYPYKYKMDILSEIIHSLAFEGFNFDIMLMLM